MSIFPTEFKAGLTFSASAILVANPAPAWCVHAYLRGPAAIDLTAAGTDARHVFTVPAATTAAWVQGLYWYSLRAASGADVVEVEAGEITIRPDLSAAAAGYDARDHAQRVLDAIEAVLERRATMDQQRYVINNRELWRTPIPDLLKLRDRYRAELRRARAARAGSLFNTQVRARFR